MRATDTIYSTTNQFQILNALTASGGTTYGPGSSGQVLTSNGTSAYWSTPSSLLGVSDASKFYRGDKTWSNTLSGAIGASSTILSLATSASLSSGSFVYGINALAANMVANSNIICLLGKSQNAKNSGYIGYNWQAAGSDNNFITIGHHSNNHLLKVYSNGHTEITTNIASTSTTTGSLTVAGGLGVAGDIWATNEHLTTNLFVEPGGHLTIRSNGADPWPFMSFGAVADSTHYYPTKASDVWCAVYGQPTYYDPDRPGYVQTQMFFREYSGSSTDGTRTDYHETYLLPISNANRTTNDYYDILTTKSPVTITQGGTGATTRSVARTNLGFYYGASAPSGSFVEGDIWFKTPS